METMTNELTVIPRTIGMVTRMMDAVNIEDAVIVSEEEQKEHPNFIESNTSGITLEELERNCIVPSFGDNQLTISHQKFIHQVEDAAKVYFTGENFGNTEIRVSHKILGRVPGALTKRKEELRPEDETIYYQRMAFCFHIRSMSRMMNGEEVHLCIGGVRSLKTYTPENHPRNSRSLSGGGFVCVQIWIVTSSGFRLFCPIILMIDLTSLRNMQASREQTIFPSTIFLSKYPSLL